MVINIPIWTYPVLIWTLVWKAMGLWRSAKNNQMAWFVLILVLNTVGILPLFYLLWFQEDKNYKILKRARKVQRSNSAPNFFQSLRARWF